MHLNCSTQKFQSTLPRGERHFSCHFTAYTRYFNPRSHEGSDDCFKFINNFCRDFNPRSHEGSDVLHEEVEKSHRYFNPRSHEGSDSLSRQLHPCPRDFNPRSHEGSDPSDNSFTSFFRGISIHAPTRGATSPKGEERGRKIFQSTLPRGERHDWNKS